MQIITINEDQKLFVIPFSGGYSCLGFEVCSKRRKALSEELEVEFIEVPDNSIANYNEYERLIALAQEKNKLTGWKSKSELIPEFIGREGERVEVVTKEGETIRFYIGKSTGFIPSHLQILRSDSIGGMSVYGYPFKQITFLGKYR